MFRDVFHLLTHVVQAAPVLKVGLILLKLGLQTSTGIPLPILRLEDILNLEMRVDLHILGLIHYLFRQRYLYGFWMGTKRGLARDIRRRAWQGTKRWGRPLSGLIDWNSGKNKSFERMRGTRVVISNQTKQ